MANDIIKLISKPLPDSPAEKHEIYAEVLPVRRTEFYKAQSLGILPEQVFRIYRFEYSGEIRIEYDDKLYALVRSYELPGSEKVELTCAGIELSQKNCKILIVSKLRTKDKDGFGKGTQQETVEIYAYKEERTGKEQSATSGAFPQRPVIFRFEKPKFILTTDYEIVFNGEFYDIQSVIEVLGREEFLEVSTVSKGLYGR